MKDFLVIAIDPIGLYLSVPAVFIIHAEDAETAMVIAQDGDKEEAEAYNWHVYDLAEIERKVSIMKLSYRQAMLLVRAGVMFEQTTMQDPGFKVQIFPPENDPDSLPALVHVVNLEEGEFRKLAFELGVLSK